MIRGVIGAGLASLGLVGGAAAIKYNDSGGATVKVKDHGVTRTVKLGGAGGQTYSCPAGTQSKLQPIDIQSGRIKLTLQDVEGELRQIQAQYPGGRAPGAVVGQYNDLVRRDRALTTAFNNTVAQHNQVIQSDCTKS
jgi:hypothetical protein